MASCRQSYGIAGELKIFGCAKGSSWQIVVGRPADDKLQGDAIQGDRSVTAYEVGILGGVERNLVVARLHLLQGLGDCGDWGCCGILVEIRELGAVRRGQSDPIARSGDSIIRQCRVVETPLGSLRVVGRGAYIRPLETAVQQRGRGCRLGEKAQGREGVGGCGADGIGACGWVVRTHLERRDGRVGGVELEVTRMVGLFPATQAASSQLVAQVIGDGRGDQRAASFDAGS